MHPRDVMETPVIPALAAAEAQLFARYQVQPQPVRLHLAGPRLSLRGFRAGDGEPVLLLHGITLVAAHWVPLIARLPARQSWQCIALNQPGHGGSDPVNFANMDLRQWHVRLLTACLDELGVESAHIVGHSYGGLFGLWLALDAPQRVRSVVTVGAPAVAFGARPDQLLALLGLPSLGRLALSLPGPLPVYRALLAWSLGRHAVAAAPPELLRATHLATRQPGFARTVASYLHEQFHGAPERRQRYTLTAQELAQITCPVLVIWGAHDQRYQRPTAARHIVTTIPGARFEVVPGGHEPWLDDVDRCAGALAEFLNRHTSATSGERA